MLYCLVFNVYYFIGLATAEGGTAYLKLNYVLSYDIINIFNIIWKNDLAVYL